MAINVAGYLYSDNGTAVQSASVTLVASDASTEATTTTNSSGYWSFAEADEDVYDIKIQSGSQIRYFKGSDKISLKEIDVRNNALATTGAATFTNYVAGTSNRVATFRSLNSSAADNDEIYLSFNLQNSASEDTEYARITAKAIDVTNGEEDGQLEFQVLKSGSPVQAFTITSSTAGAQSIDFNQDAFTFGQGADTDITFTFDANTSDGVITWMEDEDYFKFSDEILMNSTEKLLFGDTGTFIHQSSDGVLTITSDTTVDINGAVVFDGALSGITTIGASGVITAGGFTIGSAAIVESELEMIDGITAGTAAASKAVVLDGSKNIATIGTIASAAITASGTSSFGTGTTIGNLTLANGSITDSGGALDFGNETLTTTGAVDFGAATVDSLSVSDANITNVADIALDSISADGTDINVAVSDNSATALTIKQGSDAYLIVDTANSSESVSIGTGISGTAITLGHGTSEVTVGDNLTVTGDLTVSGTTTTVSSSTLTIGDTLIKLGQAYTGSAYDQGIVFTRGDGSNSNTANRAMLWDESADVFVFANTNTEAGTTSGNVTLNDYASIRVGAITADDNSTFTGTISTATGSTIGNLTLANGSITDSSGAIAFGNENLSTTGNLDIDGTANLDAVDIDGAVQIDNTVTVGVDDTGYDVKFFGDTASAYMLWDTSTDDLVLAGAAGIDLAGDLDVDGTTNLDAVDIDGAVQIDSTITVGANDQGYDIIFYGDTASANMTWDTSADDLIFNGGAGLIVPEGQFTLGSTALGSTAGELNLLDGSAKSTSSITIADADAFVVIDGNTTKQIPASDIKTYASSATAADDIGTGDDAVNLVTTSGNITIDAQANDADVIIKVDDNGSAVTAVTFDGSDEGNAIFVNDVQLKSDGALLEFGADLDTTLTHTDGAGLTLNSTNKLMFNDATQYIQGASGTVLDIAATDEIELTATLIDVVGNFANSGTITSAGIIKTDDTTNATSTTDGSLQTDGGLSVVLDAVFGDDVTLITDGAVLNLGVGSDVSITHDGTTGGTITGTPMVYQSKGAAALGNDTHSGIVLEMLAGESLAVGDWVYADSTDGRVSKADANDTGDNGHYPAIGVAVSAQGSAGSVVNILTHGTYNDSDGFGGDLTEGNLLYLSETAGGVTATAPSDDGDMVQVVGVAIGPRDVFVNPSLVVVEVA